MALNLTKLIEDLKAIQNISSDGVSNADEALEKFANAINDFVKSGALQGTTADGKTITGKVV